MEGGADPFSSANLQQQSLLVPEETVGQVPAGRRSFSAGQDRVSGAGPFGRTDF